MSLLNVKAGDWIKVQVTEINLDRNFPIRCGERLSFLFNGEYVDGLGQVAFPLESTERWMMVSDSGKDWLKRKVLMEKNGYFITWGSASTDEEVEATNHIINWKLAKEIEEENPVELTLEEIAEKFGVNVNQIKIKK